MLSKLMGPLLLMHLSLVLNTRRILMLLSNVYGNHVLIRKEKIVDGNIDILCIAETKLDDYFPNNQFILLAIIYYISWILQTKKVT